MSWTLKQFAYQGARDLGVMRPGQVLSTDLLNDILDRANQWLESENLNRYFVYALQDQTFNLTGGTQTYTIGPSEVAPNFTAPRPTIINSANILLNTVTPVVRKPLKVIGVKSRAAIPVDSIPSAIPLRLYYDFGFSATGAATIFLWPGPLANYQLELFAWPAPTYQIKQFADLTTAYTFPPGYAQFIRTNLALLMAPMCRIYSKLPMTEYDKNVVAMEMQAAQARAAIESANAPEALKQVDPAYLSSTKKAGWNYALGDYN